MAGAVSTLFLIPARGGSRRIPAKNLRLLAGIPLVGWAARIARAAAGPTDIILCSTDDPATAAAAATWGATTLERPGALASDDATSVAVALHALETLEQRGTPPDLLVLVQPTSPLTDPADLAAAVDLARRSGRSVVTVTASHPAAWHQHLAADGTLQQVDADPATTHLLTGAAYVITPAALRAGGRFLEPGQTLGLAVPVERSVDIDEPSDLLVAAAMLRARPVTPVRLGSTVLGAGRPFVIAEAGVNHDGDVAVAHRLIDAAADAGADAVKFQTFVPTALAAPSAPTAAYQRDRAGVDEQAAMLERLRLPDDAWAALQTHAEERGIVFLSTPFDAVSAALLDGLDVPAFKVGSGELTNLPFLAELAAYGRPLLISTGMATMVEVAAAVDAVRAAGSAEIALLHCVSAYPAAVEDANLAAMASMREAFGVPTGWSDHTPGIELPVAATALGAAIIEKHLTLDRSRPGPDHAMSMESDPFAAMVRAIHGTAAALGDGVKTPTDAEAAIAAVARRSLHWARDLPAGSEVALADLVAIRPGTGLPPARGADIVGRRTSRAVRAGVAVAEADL
jgi:N,N'-diacetyllegionaminate synthase